MSGPHVALMQKGAEHKAAGRLKAALQCYREAVRVAPQSGVAEHNLAAALGDAGRWREAEPHIRNIFAKGVDAPESWLVLARCELAFGRLDAADDAYGQAIRRRPTLLDAYRELAQLRWMRSGRLDDALAPVDDGIRLFPAEAQFAILKANILSAAGEGGRAYRLLADQAARQPLTAQLAGAVAQTAMAASEPAVALQFAERGADLAPGQSAAALTLIEAALCVGDAARADRLVQVLLQRTPNDQHAIALQATAWRMLGDARYSALHDYGALVSYAPLATPRGWSDLPAYLADVIAALDALHQFREHPLSQSLRHGSQASEILSSDHPALRALPEALDPPIRQHLQRLGQGSDPVRARNTGGYRFSGMWSVKLYPGGHHVDHVHPAGWLSSACHLELPEENGREGWLGFGRPGLHLKSGLPAEHFIKPAPGSVALFPSYMWHGTIPFSGSRPRLTFAFDILPA